MNYFSTTPLDPILKFWSNAATSDQFEKSNLYNAPFTLKRSHIGEQDAAFFAAANPDWLSWIPANGATFVSSEHCWQSIKATNRRTFNRFTATGDWSQFTPDSFHPFLKLKKADKNDSQKVADGCAKMFKMWSRKQCVGILAKMAVNPTYRAACGFSMVDIQYQREWLAPEVEKAIWSVILTQKFSQNPALKQRLLATRGVYLLEFDRGAAQVGRQVHWGGYITPQGQLLGANVMGIYLMQVRDALC